MKTPIIKFTKFDSSIQFEKWQIENQNNKITQIMPLLKSQTEYENTANQKTNSIEYGVMVLYFVGVDND
jgi:hypothetical protein